VITFDKTEKTDMQTNVNDYITSRACIWLRSDWREYYMSWACSINS